MADDDAADYNDDAASGYDDYVDDDAHCGDDADMNDDDAYDNGA